MAHETADWFSSEPSSSSFPGWMGVPEPTGQAPINPDYRTTNTSSSNSDNIPMPYLYSQQPPEEFDFRTLLSPSAPRFSPTLFGDVSSTIDTVPLPSFPTVPLPSLPTVPLPSLPTLGDAFLNPAGPSSIQEVELPLRGDERGDHLPASSGHYNSDGELTFRYARAFPNKMPPPEPSPLAMSSVAPADLYDNVWAGYPLVQHTVGAASAGYSGQMTGVNMNVGLPAFTFTPSRAAQSHPQGLPHGLDVADRGSTTVFGAGDTAQPKGKRPRRDTTERISCTYPGCDTSKCTLSPCVIVNNCSSQLSLGLPTSGAISRASI